MFQEALRVEVIIAWGLSQAQATRYIPFLTSNSEQIYWADNMEQLFFIYFSRFYSTEKRSQTVLIKKIYWGYLHFHFSICIPDSDNAHISGSHEKSGFLFPIHHHSCSWEKTKHSTRYFFINTQSQRELTLLYIWFPVLNSARIINGCSENPMEKQVDSWIWANKNGSTISIICFF